MGWRVGLQLLQCAADGSGHRRLGGAFAAQVDEMRHERHVLPVPLPVLQQKRTARAPIGQEYRDNLNDCR